MSYASDDPLVLFGVVKKEHVIHPPPSPQQRNTTIPPTPMHAPPCASLPMQMRMKVEEQVEASGGSGTRVVRAVQPPPAATDCSQSQPTKPKRKLTDLSAW